MQRPSARVGADWQFMGIPNFPPSQKPVRAEPVEA